MGANINMYYYFVYDNDIATGTATSCLGRSSFHSVYNTIPTIRQTINCQQIVNDIDSDLYHIFQTSLPTSFLQTSVM